MSSSKKLALAGDVLFYLKRAGIDIDYGGALELAGSLLSDEGWDITFRAGLENECTESGCCDREPSPPVPAEQDAAEAALTTAHIDEIAHRVLALLKERL